MGDVGIESTLVLDGLAVSKVRFYSTLDSDVGKRVEITDKFNPSNVFTGTFDASLNLLYDLPAFTSYEVKMYGLDGETVESDQTFMLKGYDYLEKNVGLNKNSFAGIKAIVDQGLEDSMIEIGHEFTEDDNVGDDGGTWIVVAKNYGTDVPYRHTVFLGRKYALPIIITIQMSRCAYPVGTEFQLYLENSYYPALPSGIKDNITPRRFKTWGGHTNAVQFDRGYGPECHVWNPSFSECKGSTTGTVYTSWGGKTITAENDLYPRFPYYANGLNPKKKNGNNASIATRSGLANSAGALGQAYWTLGYISSNGYIGQYGADVVTLGLNLLPHMMIASEPIE